MHKVSDSGIWVSSGAADDVADLCSVSVQVADECPEQPVSDIADKGLRVASVLKDDD